MNEYVDIRNGGYYVAGTRVGLDLIYDEFQNGKSAESILDAYPTIGSLAKVYGAIAFLLDHPAEIDKYLADQVRLFDELKPRHPLPSETRDRFDRARRQRSLNQN